MMEDLQLAANGFSGPLPKELAKLGRLKTLYLA
jgi:hypothetical protein